MSEKKFSLFDEEQADYFFQYDQYKKLLEPVESLIPILKAQIELTSKTSGKAKTAHLKVLDSILKTIKGIIDDIVELHKANLQYSLEILDMVYKDVKPLNITEMVSLQPEEQKQEEQKPEVTEPVQPVNVEPSETTENEIEFIDLDSTDHPI